MSRLDDKPSSAAMDLEHPLRPVVSAWQETLRRAKEKKEKAFDEWARQIMAFYTGDAEVIWDQYMTGKARNKKEPSHVPEVKFPMCLAKVAEGVQIFGPTIYHRNPARTVTPRTFAEPEHDL